MSCCGGGDAFTAAQLEELGRQAMIYKHFVAGVPVPPDLLLPASRSSCAPASSPLYYHPTLGYLSYYGKKLDPEPGRCRRTDGKKWRCAKDAHPDSKYCEKHMHRNRNRSRKPVENKSLPQSQAPPAASLHPSSEEAGNGSGSYTSFGSAALQQSRVHAAYSTYSTTPSASQWQLDLGSYGLGNKDYRSPSGMKAEFNQNSLISKNSGSAKGSGMDSSVSSSWSLMPSEVLASFVSKGSTSSVLQNSSYPQLHSSHDMGQPALSLLSAQQQQHSFFNGYGLSDPGKHEAQPLLPFFDELPKTRGMWSNLDEEQSRKNFMSTTQLSISIPNGSSGYISTNSRSSGGVPLF